MTDDKRMKWPKWVSDLFPQRQPPRDRPFLKPGVAILNDPRFDEVAQDRSAFPQADTDYGTRGMEAARIRKGIIAALKELRDTAVLDHPRDRPLQDLINNPLAVPVTGHINMLRLIQAVIDATADSEAQPEVIALPVQTLRDIEAQAAMDKIMVDPKDLKARRSARKFMGMPVIVDPRLPPNFIGIDYATGPDQSASIGYRQAADGKIEVVTFSMNCPMCHRSMELQTDQTEHECPSCLHTIYLKLGDDQ